MDPALGSLSLKVDCSEYNFGKLLKDGRNLFIFKPSHGDSVFVVDNYRPNSFGATMPKLSSSSLAVRMCRYVKFFSRSSCICALPMERRRPIGTRLTSLSARAPYDVSKKPVNTKMNSPKKAGSQADRNSQQESRQFDWSGGRKSIRL